MLIRAGRGWRWRRRGLAAAAAPTCGLVARVVAARARPQLHGRESVRVHGRQCRGLSALRLQRMQGVTCEKGEVTFVIDVSEFADDDSAYGMFAANRDQRQPSAKIGAGGQILPRRATL